jgi:hypothetical protein
LAIQKIADQSFTIGVLTDEFEYDPTVPSKERDFYSQNFLELKG